MDLIRINEVVMRFDLSSRTLRYYEQVGILWSIHPDSKPLRYYDDAAIERLKQIIILRKLQIPIKDIISIFKENSTASLTQAFVERLEALDKEIAALSDLRQLVDEFLQKMYATGIKKISAIALLYEETKKRLVPMEESQAITFAKLSEISHEVLRLKDVRIIRLPAMRVLTSCRKNGETAALDTDSMQNLFTDYGFIPTPGLRNCFYLRKSSDEWIMIIKIPEDYINTSPYIDTFFQEGLFAIASSFMENMDETFRLLREWISEDENFEIDLNERGVLRCNEMIEEILPWDIAQMRKQYQQDVFVSVKLK